MGIFEGPKHARTFYCPECCVRFDIHVEANTHYDVVKEQYPDSIKWLDKIKGKDFQCPVCGTEIEEDT